MTNDIWQKCLNLKNKISQNNLSNASPDELVTLIRAHESGFYTLAHQTKLYAEHFGEYCKVITLLDDGL